MKNLEPVQTTLKNGIPIEIGKLGKMAEYFAFELQNPNHSLIEREVFLVSSFLTKFNNSEIFSIEDIALLEITDFNFLSSLCDNFRRKISFASLHNETAIKLGSGVELCGVIYDLIEFDKTATLLQKIEASKAGLSPSGVDFYLIMKEISVIKQSESGIVFEGEITLEDLSEMTLDDGANLILLRQKLRNDNYNKQRAGEAWDAVLNAGFLDINKE